MAENGQDLSKILNGYREMLEEFREVAGQGTVIAIQTKIDLADHAIKQSEKGGESDIKYLNAAIKIIREIRNSFNLK